MRTSGVRLHHDLRVPVGSETVAATRYQPVTAARADDPKPAVLMVIPYRKDDYITYGAYDPLLRYVARAGYEVVVADLVGTGGSTGVKPQPLSADEGAEAVALIEWLADRKWTTGRIGMLGKSYGGWTQLLAAERDPEPLDAVVPIMAPFSAYDDSRYPTGAMSLKHAGGWLPMMQTFAALPPSYRDDEGRWAEVWHERLDGLAEGEPWLFDQLRNETRNDYWRKHAVDVSRTSVPVFSVCGWRDYFPTSTLGQLRAVDAPTRILMGPWRHAMPHRGREAAVEVRERVVEWFDHFLRDEDTDALERPFLTHWTEREGGGVVDGGVWRTRDGWPTVAESESPLSFAFSSSGLVPAESFSEGQGDAEDEVEVAADYEFDATVGARSLHYLAPPLDTNPDDVRSLCFETDAFADPVELTGTGEATVRLRPSTEDLLLTVRLLDVSPDGSASLVTYGTRRASHRNSSVEPETLAPGEEHAVDVPLRPTSHVFESGHRLRVAVGSAFFPRLLAPREHGSMTVLSSPDAASGVSFPGRRHAGSVAFDDRTTLPAPDEREVPTSSRFVTESRSEFETAREHRTDRLAVRSVDEKRIDLPHGPTMDYREEVEWTGLPTDPAGVHVETQIEAALEYETDVVRVETTARTGRDGAALSQHVTRDGQSTFEKTWRL